MARTATAVRPTPAHLAYPAGPTPRPHPPTHHVPADVAAQMAASIATSPGGWWHTTPQQTPRAGGTR